MSGREIQCGHIITMALGHDSIGGTKIKAEGEGSGHNALDRRVGLAWEVAFIGQSTRGMSQLQWWWAWNDKIKMRETKYGFIFEQEQTDAGRSQRR